MRLLTFSITLLALLAFCLPAMAQYGYLKGCFTEAETGEPVPFASVICTHASGTTTGATTDFDGLYSISLPAGVYQVRFAYVGYEDFTYTIEIKAGETTTLNHKAAAQTLRLEAVTLVASKSIKNINAGKFKKEKGGNNNSYTPAPPAPFDPYAPVSTSNYHHIDENGYKDPIKEPLSTLSIDVDKASYSNVRQFLNSGQLPPVDAVRVEELINYFSYDYPQPTGEDPFSISLEGGACPWNPAHQLVMVGIQGQNLQLDTAAASNLVFLIDVSGSMDSPSKLGLIKNGLRMMVEELKPDDFVTIVVYASAQGLALPPTPGTQKNKILAALDNLHAGGSTAGGAGIKLAYEMARKHYLKNGNNRVILATDGDFNVGVSSDSELQKLIEEERKSGVFLSILGVGTDNLMDGRMNMLAEKGNGQYFFLDNLMEAHKVLVQEMGGTLFTIAKDVKIQVEFNPALVKAYRLIGYETRLLNAEDFNNDQKDAGEIGAGHSVTALYEIIPAGSTDAVPGIDELKYQKQAPTEASGNGELLTIKFRYKAPDGDKSKLITHTLLAEAFTNSPSENFRFASAVVGFGMLLRNSPYKGLADFDLVKALASKSLGKDAFGYRGEFTRLVNIAETLTKQQKRAETKK